MWWGIVLVTGVAFCASTEFVPELNEKLRLVPFSMDFKVRLTTVMVVDFMGCYVVEKVLKALYSDYKPKDIAERRPDQIKFEEERNERERREREDEEEKKRGEAMANANANVKA